MAFALGMEVVQAFSQFNLEAFSVDVIVPRTLRADRINPGRIGLPRVTLLTHLHSTACTCIRPRLHQIPE